MENAVEEKFNSYPVAIRKNLLLIRNIIFEVVEQENLGLLEETLKWGQPSYLVKNGSTVRIDHSPKIPSQYAVYFHCQTILIEVFKEVYGDIFRYEGTRALIFSTEDELPAVELKRCLSMALRYHKIKHIPLLGA